MTDKSIPIFAGILTDSKKFQTYKGKEIHAEQQADRAICFFQNRDCEYFPCHTGVREEDFNCLFCYCPLYPLGEHCGGSFVYLENGVKCCENCNFPHRRENYSAVLRRYPELAELAKRKPGDKV